MQSFRLSSLVATRAKNNNYISLGRIPCMIHYTFKPTEVPGMPNVPPFAQLDQDDLDVMWQYLATHHKFVPSHQEKTEAEYYFCAVAEGRG